MRYRDRMLRVPADNRRALIDAGGQFAYCDLDRAATALAAGLCAGRRDLEERRVAILARGFDYAAALLGIWRAGGVAVPLCASHPPAELEFVIRDAGAECVVADRALFDRLASVTAATRVPTTLVPDLCQTSPPAASTGIADDRRAMIVYTSGTTGRPKGVVTTHANIAAQVDALVKAWGWNERDRMLHVLPLHHVHGIVNGLLCALASGAVCEMLPVFDAERAWARFASGEVTMFTAVPTIYQKLIAAWERAEPPVQRVWAEGARGLRLMMSGSAALPLRTLERWRAITGHTLLERYGMTELGMALSNPLDGIRRPGFVGGPLPGVEVRLVDDTGTPVGVGAPGEIEVRGHGVFLEYWQRPSETAAAFRNGWFRTGDTAVVEHGAYRILGRNSVDIIKTGGEKVSALEIENVLREHPAIADCAVVGVTDETWGETVSVAIELKPGATVALDELRAWARSRLAPYKIPKAIRVVDSLPRNTLGKVIKPEVVAIFV